jgi:hypothetical protein
MSRSPKQIKLSKLAKIKKVKYESIPGNTLELNVGYSENGQNFVFEEDSVTIRLTEKTARNMVAAISKLLGKNVRS